MKRNLMLSFAMGLLLAGAVSLMAVSEASATYVRVGAAGACVVDNNNASPTSMTTERGAYRNEDMTYAADLHCSFPVFSDLPSDIVNRVTAFVWDGHDSDPGDGRVALQVLTQSTTSWSSWTQCGSTDYSDDLQSGYETTLEVDSLAGAACTYSNRFVNAIVTLPDGDDSYSRLIGLCIEDNESTVCDV